MLQPELAGDLFQKLAHAGLGRPLSLNVVNILVGCSVFQHADCEMRRECYLELDLSFAVSFYTAFEPENTFLKYDGSWT